VPEFGPLLTVRPPLQNPKTVYRCYGFPLAMTAEHDSDSSSDTLTEKKIRVRKPRQYKVLLLNDDYTTMEFVVSILETIFQKTPAEATQIMLHVHQKGSGLCGIFPKQIAEAKTQLVHDRARAEGHPLRCIIEEA
jgi:ATP-dependent Clp protease adaptor protein ClpS